MRDVAANGARHEWVDTARGIGIIFVVYGHALRGHVTSGAFEASWHADVQDVVIYAFHMPLFFFLAGLFAERSLRKGAALFVREKAVTLIYPYLLWSTVSVELAVLAAGSVNHDVEANRLLTIWHDPVYQYWFLYTLLLCQLVTLVTRADWRVTLLLGGVSAVGIGATGGGIVSSVLNYFVYFALGMLLSRFLLAWRPGPKTLVCVAALSVFAFGVSFLAPDDLPYRLLIVGRAVLGCAAVVTTAMLTAPSARWLALLGTASMAIYVLHTIFSACVRIGLRNVGFSHDLATLVIGTIVGILAPLAIWVVAKHYGVLPWLGLGTQPRRTLARQA